MRPPINASDCTSCIPRINEHIFHVYTSIAHQIYFIIARLLDYTNRKGCKPVLSPLRFIVRFACSERRKNTEKAETRVRRGNPSDRALAANECNDKAAIPSDPIDQLKSIRRPPRPNTDD